MSRLKKRHAVAALSTLLFHGLLAVALLCLYLRYDSTAEPPEWPPADSSELLFGGDIVRLGDYGPDEPAAASVAEATAAEPAPEQAGEPDVQPQPAPPAPTAKQPSPAKAREDQAAREAAAREAAAQKAAAEKAAREAAAREQIANRMNFGSGNGAAGQPDGTSTSGKVSGVSASGLGNRRALAMPEPAPGPLGKITVKIAVDAAGNVTSAAFHSGDGAAAASAQSRSRCVEAAKRAKFSASQTQSQTGYLTYIFK